MGSSTSRINDQMIDEEIKSNQQWLEQLAEQIKQTQTYGSEIIERRWLEENRKKILRNRRLIDLLG